MFVVLCTIPINKVKNVLLAINVSNSIVSEESGRLTKADITDLLKCIPSPSYCSTFVTFLLIKIQKKTVICLFIYEYFVNIAQLL